MRVARIAVVPTMVVLLCACDPNPGDAPEGIGGTLAATFLAILRKPAGISTNTYSMKQSIFPRRQRAG